MRPKDRRSGDGSLGARPRPNPVNLLVLTITAVLAATAAATAMLGSGFDDHTPHGQLLGDLEEVAESQAAYFAQTGSFALWVRSLEVEPTEGVRLTLLRADGSGWKALATHPVGLTCIQEGLLDRRGRPVRKAPECFVERVE